MRTQRQVIALAGLSGAGKSTLIAETRNADAYVDYCASDLIKSHLQSSGGYASSEALRKGDITDNQKVLIDAFANATAEEHRHILLDCHTLIDTPNGIQFLGPETFAACGVTQFLFLWVDANEIIRRRSGDSGRNRPTRTAEQISAQQVLAKQVASDVAVALEISFTQLNDSPLDHLRRILEALPSQAGR